MYTFNSDKMFIWLSSSLMLQKNKRKEKDQSNRAITNGRCARHRVIKKDTIHEPLYIYSLQNISCEQRREPLNYLFSMLLLFIISIININTMEPRFFFLSSLLMIKVA